MVAGSDDPVGLGPSGLFKVVMVRIRLSRRGRKKVALYDVVIADVRAPRDGACIEKIGTYNPNTNPADINIQPDRALHWLLEGAQPSDTVRSLLSKTGVMLRKHLHTGVLKGKITQQQMDEKLKAWKEEKLRSQQAFVKAENEKRKASKKTASEREEAFDLKRRLAQEKALKSSSEAEQAQPSTPDQGSEGKGDAGNEQPPQEVQVKNSTEDQRPKPVAAEQAPKSSEAGGTGQGTGKMKEAASVETTQTPPPQSNKGIEPSPVVDAIKKEDPAGDAIKKEDPAGDAIKKEDPAGDATKKEDPAGDAIKKEDPAGDAIKKEDPAGDAIKKEDPAGDGLAAAETTGEDVAKNLAGAQQVAKESPGKTKDRTSSLTKASKGPAGVGADISKTKDDVAGKEAAKTRPVKTSKSTRPGPDTQGKPPQTTRKVKDQQAEAAPTTGTTQKKKTGSHKSKVDQGGAAKSKEAAKGSRTKVEKA